MSGAAANFALAQCCNCQPIETDHHANQLRPDVNEHTSDQFTDHRNWLLDDFFKGQVLPALMMFTEQMSAVAMQQVMIIGTFMDAKQQLETQRLFQELQTQAHKDYQPSEDFCWFGTNVRSLAHSEASARSAAHIISQVQMRRHLGHANMAAAQSGDSDKYSRWKQFQTKFCDPQDNNWVASNPSTGLALACGSGASNSHSTNADIDYTRVIETPRMINFDVETIFALGNNLYGHNVLARDLSESDIALPQYNHLYLALRSVAAKRSVAQNSFNVIVGMKAAGTSNMDSSEQQHQTWRFLGAILGELGVPPGEIDDMIGRSPSYYAQLELLAKKIYQNPDFYSNLYDKPANVKRKSVALKAVELMLDRAIYESQIRQEMATSVLLSARLQEPFKSVDKKLGVK
ncbi:MAG: hypothetical protein ACPGRX_01015 [Bdellovibrionales bacterium]